MRDPISETTNCSKRSRKRPPGLIRLLLILAAMWALVALTGCDSHDVEEIDFTERIDDAELVLIAPNRESGVLYFGFELRGSPDEDARQYLPLLKYLEQATGLRFELRFTPGGARIADLLGTGEFHFAAVGAGIYLRARERYGVIPLVRGLNAEGRDEYQSAIVVVPDSPIRSVEELRGKSFAFAGATSTQGYLIPRIVLAEHGISLDDLARYKHTCSHQNCANTVISGRSDATGVQDIFGRRLAAEGIVRIIHTSEFYPSSGIAANRDVPPDVIQKVKQALLDFEPTGAHAEGLYHWDRTEMASGFIEAHDDDYAELREWSIRFGLLNAPAGERAQ